MHAGNAALCLHMSMNQTLRNIKQNMALHTDSRINIHTHMQA